MVAVTIGMLITAIAVIVARFSWETLSLPLAVIAATIQFLGCAAFLHAATGWMPSLDAVNMVLSCGILLFVLGLLIHFWPHPELEPYKVRIAPADELPARDPVRDNRRLVDRHAPGPVMYSRVVNNGRDDGVIDVDELPALTSGDAS